MAAAANDGSGRHDAERFKALRHHLPAVEPPRESMWFNGPMDLARPDWHPGSDPVLNGPAMNETGSGRPTAGRGTAVNKPAPAVQRPVVD